MVSYKLEGFVFFAGYGVELVVLLADSFFDTFCAVELVLEEAAGVTLHPASSCDAAVSKIAPSRGFRSDKPALWISIPI